MGHRIFVGPFEALEARWLEEVSRKKADEPLAPITVLVGSNLLASYLKMRIAEGGKAVANLRFYTFLDLAMRLAPRPATGDQKPRLPRIGASAILESILGSNSPKVFRAVSGYRGFLDAVLDTFRDLRDAGVTAEDLKGGIRRCMRDAPDRSQQLSGLSDLYALFREKVERFHGTDDDFRDACRDSHRTEKLLAGGPLLVYGIYDVTGQQSDLLSALKHAAELMFFIPYIDEPVSAFARKFVEAQESQLGVSAEMLPGPVRQDTLGRLARMDFGFHRQGFLDAGPGRAGQALEDDGSVALVSVPGESRAAIEIVREVLRAIRDRKIRGFHEAAVILRQPEVEVPILAEAFRLRNIPYFVQGGTPFIQRPLARAVLSLVGLESNSFSRQAILTAMEWVSASVPEGSWIPSDWYALTADSRFLAGVQAWTTGTEELVRDALSGLRLAEEVAAGSIGGEEEEKREAPSLPFARRRLSLARSLQSGWIEIRNAAANWPDSLSWKGWAQLLVRRLEPLLKTSEDWGPFSTVLDEIEALGAIAERAGIERMIRRERLTALLEESLSSLACSEGRFLRNGINLVSASAARGLRFPLVIIPGLEEGNFPARLRQDPLLLDTERGKIGSPPRLPFKSQRASEEKLLFDMCARSAEKRLVLVASRLDEASDRERIPSEFFISVAATLRGAPVGLRDLSEGAVPGFRSVSLEQAAPRRGQIAVDQGEVRLRLVTSGSARAVLKMLAREEPELILRPLEFDDARWKGYLTAFDGKISDPTLLGYINGILGAEAGPVSASRLESYAKCPYLFYLRRVMELDPLEEQEAPRALNPMARGEVVHAILEDFLREQAGEKLPGATKEDLGAALLAVTRPALEKARPRGMYDLLWEIEREGLEIVLTNWLEFEKDRQGLSPSFFERPFGRFSPTESYPELTVMAGRHRFMFRGRIDRIDLSSDGRVARVIDYKTGKLPETMGKRVRPLLMAGEKTQLAVYQGALRSLDGLNHVEEVVGEYLHLQPWDGQIVPCSYSSSELNQAAERLPAILEIIGDGVGRGVFFARSSGSVRPDGHCRWCAFLNICGKDRTQREERKSADPDVLRFGSMRDIDRPEEAGE